MITSTILGLIPFIANTDATRLQMASKQITQSISHKNCQIPYVVSKNCHYITNESGLGIKLARTSGEVLFNSNDLFIVRYNDGSVEIDKLPIYRKTHGEFCSQLRFSKPVNSKFNTGQLLWEYDSFNNSIPSFGYNVFSAYFPFFGYTFEDSLVISEELANRSNVNYFEKIYIPVYEHTIMKKRYYGIENSLVYFPGLGQELIDDVLCCYLIPKSSNEYSTRNLKKEVTNAMSTMNVSDLLTSYDNDMRNFDSRLEKTKLHHAKLNGFRIHHIKKDIELVDKDLSNLLKKLYMKYGERVVEIHSDLSKIFPAQYSNKLIKQYYLYTDKDKERCKINLTDCVYLLEFEVVSANNNLQLGDKLTNRFAGKGVVSLILPDELRPVAINSNTPIDYIYNPMGVFSRMNVGQLIEGLVAKSVYYCDREIKNNPEKTVEILSWLSDNVIQNLNMPDYHEQVKLLINNLSQDNTLMESFLEDVRNSNLYIYAPAFSKLDTKKLVQQNVPSNEPVLIKKELFKYMRDKLKLEVPFSPVDVEIPNIFCVPMYISRLYKIAAKLINSRDYGPIKVITKQPSKGRSKAGGSKLGQMELKNRFLVIVISLQ